MRKTTCAAVLLTALALDAFAQESFSLEVATAGLEELYRDGLQGTEVEIDGALRVYISDAIKFANDTGFYDVKFDAGRQARKEIEACELNPFDWTQSQCFAKGKAELEVDISDGDLAKGWRVTLIVYEIEIRREP